MNICDMYDAHEFLDYLDAVTRMQEQEVEKANAKRARSR